MKRLPVLVLAMCSVAASAFASIELGKITADTVEAYAGYFETYLKTNPPIFPREESDKVKLIAEARDVHRWLKNYDAWPAEEKRTPEMYLNASKLFYYFSRLDLPGTKEEALKMTDAAVAKDPNAFAPQLQKAMMLAELEPSRAVEGAEAAERALELKPEEARAQQAHYLAADAYYRAGFFAKAYDHLKKQAAADAAVEDTQDKLFVWETRIKTWGYVPEKVRFEKTELGYEIPVPDSPSPVIE